MAPGPAMAPGPKATLLVLSMEERAGLERIARRHKAGQALATRARVVLACAESGATNMGVSRALGGAPDGGAGRRAAQRGAAQGGRRGG